MRCERTVLALLFGCVATFSAGCSRRASKPDAPSKTTTVEFSRVPLDLVLPPGWRLSQNTDEWLVYRPSEGGALAAMSGEKSCSLVEKRLYTALIELGLNQVVWQNAPRQGQVNGLRATLADGTAVESSNPSKVKYSLVQADGGLGCVVTVVSYWATRETEIGPAADAILRSVRRRK